MKDTPHISNPGILQRKKKVYLIAKFPLSSTYISRRQLFLFFKIKDEGLHPISQLFLKCTGLQQLGRREPFTPDALPLF
ncbi:hypothetical protein [Bacteroides heparinolyticus]|uniref:hypothetical protein n=1 Tax=Prevotella heparinolytica TaxID=28113 RepID=UPI0023F3694D|nr:hypothetical protein [Bacteroides heparinolyticus]